MEAKRTGVDSGARPSDTPPRWRRAGLITGTLWVPVGLVVAFVSARAGFPTGSGWLFVTAGLVILWVVGRPLDLHGRRAWILAGVLAVVVLWIVGGILLFSLAMAGCPGMTQRC
jgi:hypothetical protein